MASCLMSILSGYLDAIDLSKADDTLVLGGGTGVEIRELVGRSNFQGNATATDIGPELS